MKFLRELKKMLLYSTVIFIILIFVGSVYQWFAQKHDQKQFSPPGKMINLGDHQLHIQIRGRSPVIVLEAASDGSSANWEWVMEEISKITTVCAYDRAGHGWSELANEQRGAVHIADELHTLLGQANIESPYIVVGHSAGALFVRAYQQRFPKTVAGMVLIDGNNEHETAKLSGFTDQL